MRKQTPRGIALLPILVFLVIYLGSGIYYEYINPVEGGMGFYIMSVVVAFMIALIVAFIQNRDLDLDDKIHACAQGIGDDNITTMLFIFLMAGAFSGIASAAGGAESTAHMLLNAIPADFAVPGLFLISCIISLSMGTSCGTISVIAPIALSVSTSAGLHLPLCIAAVVGGSMFGDNLSFISDTTIAATKTQGVEMRDKFRKNLWIACPAALITLVLLIVLCLNRHVDNLERFDYNVWQALPYFVVLIAAIIGINVFIVLGGGIILSAIAGVATGTLDGSTAFSSMGDGVSGMFEVMIVTILVASLGSLMKEYGGFEWILQFIRKHFKGKKGGMFGIGVLASLMDIATANNTVAIVMAGPIAKDISREFQIDPRDTASYLDIFSCVWQGIIPYGAQLLMAAGAAGISSVSIVPFLFYPFVLFACAIISILIKKN